MSKNIIEPRWKTFVRHAKDGQSVDDFFQHNPLQSELVNIFGFWVAQAAINGDDDDMRFILQCGEERCDRENRVGFIEVSARYTMHAGDFDATARIFKELPKGFSTAGNILGCLLQEGRFPFKNVVDLCDTVFSNVPKLYSPWFFQELYADYQPRFQENNFSFEDAVFDKHSENPDHLWNYLMGFLQGPRMDMPDRQKHGLAVLRKFGAVLSFSDFLEKAKSDDYDFFATPITKILNDMVLADFVKRGDVFSWDDVFYLLSEKAVYTALEKTPEDDTRGYFLDLLKMEAPALYTLWQKHAIEKSLEGAMNHTPKTLRKF